VPGLAGGDGFRGGGGEVFGIRGDANAAEVEAVGVEADGEGGIGLGRCAVVDLTGGDEEVHGGVGEVEMAGLAEGDGELRAARAVQGISVFVLAAGIVEDGEEADDFLIGSMQRGEVEAVAADGEPVGRPVVGVLAEAELGGDELPEGLFVREEQGQWKIEYLRFILRVQWRRIFVSWWGCRG
jgi:hypothetical protein